MKLTRRNFVKAGGASALALAALSGTTLGVSRDGAAFDGLSAANFRAVVGQEFFIWNERSSTVATLARIDEFSGNSGSGECFGLLFESTKKRTSEGTFYVFHAELGTFELFLTEARSGRRGGFYATINRI